MVLESILISLFYTYLHSFTTTTIEETVFSLLYIIIASFVKDKMCIGVWVYLLAFYLVPLVYMYVFVPIPYFLDDCSFIV